MSLPATIYAELDRIVQAEAEASKALRELRALLPPDLKAKCAEISLPLCGVAAGANGIRTLMAAAQQAHEGPARPAKSVRMEDLELHPANVEAVRESLRRAGDDTFTGEDAA